MIRRLAICLMLASVAMSALAQSASTPLPLVVPESRSASAVLPVVNRETGKFEAFLLVEPEGLPAGLSGVDSSHLPSLAVRTLMRPAGDTGNHYAPALRLDASLRLERGGNMALLCDGAASVLNSLGGLASHCLLGALDEPADPLALYSPALRADATLSQGPLRLGLGVGLQRFNLTAPSAPPALYRVEDGSVGAPWWNQPLLNGYLNGLHLNQIDVSGQARLALGEQGWLSIGGSLARARLIANTNALFGGNDWTRSAVSFGGGYGAFSGTLIGHTLQSASGATWQGLDLGFSWQTPWNARLSIGAENILSSGDNRTGLGEVGLPTAPKGRTPYVRYQQDL